MKDKLLNEIIKDYEFFRYKHNMIDVLKDSFCLMANTISNQVDRLALSGDTTDEALSTITERDLPEYVTVTMTQ